ncbi:hypothetical protein A2125_00645 [Candidatus Woesebacteria bacterium GWB1_43_5]|uniref:Endolytic murein transglycosylase n=1 Tax=Candidatus Woesebacteria bacterium GWB1_43_5 TaxID=1802474 RepID=A0A1F7WSJ2_9BACT|nr:MAG: hypothetical protein A2125_00645 [Candidatus Woesebacteria bacterium GWB1_43_5]
MRKIVIFLGVLAVFGLSIFGGLLWIKDSFAPRASETKFQKFLITKGSSALGVANKLEEEGFVKSALAFKVYTQVTGLSRRILAGEYEISPHMSLIQIVSKLTSGPLEVWVTVREGLRREEVAEKFIEGLSKSGEEGALFRQEFLSLSKDKEGLLFPDTYLFPKEASASAVVARMRSTFDRRMEEFEGQVVQSDLTLIEIATLASILERETVTDEERPIVAGILLNRLKINMGLQADATVQYAKANAKCLPAQTGQMPNAKCDWWEPLLKEDLNIDSPYNTYKYRGLPPAPIASPGLSSLKAAIKPESTDYLYYLHDDSGGIHYASTLEEHNGNVSRYLGK